MPRIGEFMGPSPFRDRDPKPTAIEKLAKGIHACTGAVLHLAEITVAAVQHTPEQGQPAPTAVMQAEASQPSMQEAA